MEAMSPTTCPHGLDPANCEICRVLQPTPVLAGRSAPGRGGRRGPPSLATIVVVAILGFLVIGWVAAAVFAVLRILELVAIAALAGWVGFHAGVRRGRRRPR
jgi:hypothetical protein